MTAPRDEMHQIGDAAAAVGLSLRTLRHYEEVELALPSGRSPGGFRLYTDDDIHRLRLIKQMKPLEFSLDEMRELLEIRDRLAAGIDDEVERAELLDRLGMFAAAAEERCSRLRTQLQAAESLATDIRREANRRRSSARSAR